MFIKRLLLMVSTLVTMSVFLTACGGAAVTQESAPTAEEASEPTEAADNAVKVGCLLTMLSAIARSLILLWKDICHAVARQSPKKALQPLRKRVSQRKPQIMQSKLVCLLTMLSAIARSLILLWKDICQFSWAKNQIE